MLRDLRRGDELRVERPDGGSVRYRIDELLVADSRSARLSAPASGRALLLVTCWPFDALTPGGPMRYVVTARAPLTTRPAFGSRRRQSRRHPAPLG